MTKVFILFWIRRLNKSKYIYGSEIRLQRTYLLKCNLLLKKGYSSLDICFVYVNSTTVVPMIILIPNITDSTDIMGQLKKSRFQESD